MGVGNFGLIHLSSPSTCSPNTLHYLHRLTSTTHWEPVRQGIHSQALKRGIKAWVLADSSTGYTWNWKLYSGKEGDIFAIGLAHSAILELIYDVHKHKGYVVVTENFYGSPSLFRDLLSRGFGARGRVHQGQVWHSSDMVHYPREERLLAAGMTESFPSSGRIREM